MKYEGVTLRSMAFSTLYGAESAVKISAALDVSDGLLDIEQVKLAEER